MKLHRFLLKSRQLQANGRAPLCPLCAKLGRKPERATHMHELWVPPHKGSKYHIEYETVWTILICERCNLFEANSHKRELMEIQVERYGREGMQLAIEEARAVCKIKWVIPTLD